MYIEYIQLRFLTHPSSPLLTNSEEKNFNLVWPKRRKEREGARLRTVPQSLDSKHRENLENSVTI